MKEKSSTCHGVGVLDELVFRDVVDLLGFLQQVTQEVLQANKTTIIGRRRQREATEDESR